MSTSGCVPKLTGADVELGNFIEGNASCATTVGEASLALLAEIRRAVGAEDSLELDAERAQDNPQDRGRTFFRTNGGCAYIDLDHLELCLPEVLSATDHVAYWHAMLRVASQAQASLNACRAPHERIQLLANNSDGRVSYGSHLNVLVSRPAWDNIVHRKPHYLAWLAAFQVSSLPITGAGKVGSENGASPVPYQLSQRSDYFEAVTGMQTTYMRPLVNTRDEPHAGRWHEARGPYARFHSIFFDSTLCHGSTYLRVGLMQIALAMIEAGRVDSSIALDDPLLAVRQWSCDPLLEATADLVCGEKVTAIQLQRRFLDQAVSFVDGGQVEGIVPDAREILALWDDTLSKFEARNWPVLARRLDWLLKLSFLERAFDHRPELEWTSPEIKHLDHLYSSLDHAEGLYWSVADREMIECRVSAATIDECMHRPPEGTRAWSRAMLMRQAGSAIEHVDWDHMRVRLRERSGMSVSWQVDFPDPLRANRVDVNRIMRDSSSMQELLIGLGASPTTQVWESEGASAHGAVNGPLVLGQRSPGGTRSARAAWPSNTRNDVTRSGGNDGTN